MSCLNPYIRIRYGLKRWKVEKNADGSDKFIDYEETGEVKEKGILLMDLPSNRENLEVLNIPYTIIPCGVCDECYKKRVKEWSIRILNETKYNKENYFITLTYDDVHIPRNHSLDKKRIQTFFKSLKKHISRDYPDIKIKYYCVGEYGEGKGEREYLNPHYHFIGFNIPLTFYGLTDVFPDGHKHNSKSGDTLMFCQMLQDLWPEGFVTVQEVTFGSAAYVAGYVHKKLKDSKPIIHEELGFYNFRGRAYSFIAPRRYDPYEFLGVERPWSLMSKGIGERYFNDHQDKIYDTDEVFYNSGKFGIMSSLPPRYYDKKLKEHNHEKSKLIVEKRTALSQAKNGFATDKDYLYNKNIKVSRSESKMSNRKRGMASLS